MYIQCITYVYTVHNICTLYVCYQRFKSFPVFRNLLSYRTGLHTTESKILSYLDIAFGYSKTSLFIFMQSHFSRIYLIVKNSHITSIAKNKN